MKKKAATPTSAATALPASAGRPVMDLLVSEMQTKAAALVQDPNQLYDLLVEHHVKIAPVVLLIVVWTRYTSLYFRALLIAGYSTLYLTDDPEIWIWPYIAGLMCLSVLLAGRQRPVSINAEAYHHFYRTKVEAFYREHAPEKLAEVDTIMFKYRGNERLLWEKLQKKYCSTDFRQDDVDQDLDEPVPVQQQRTPSRHHEPEVVKSSSPALVRAREEARRLQEERLNRRLHRKKA